MHIQFLALVMHFSFFVALFSNYYIFINVATRYRLNLLPMTAECSPLCMFHEKSQHQTNLSDGCGDGDGRARRGR